MNSTRLQRLNVPMVSLRRNDSAIWNCVAFNTFTSGPVWVGRLNKEFGLIQAYVAADVTSLRYPWAPPTRLDGTDFPFSRTSFCSYTRVP